MEQSEYEKLKTNFLKLVASVPLQLRTEIIAVVDGQTVDWLVASEEVKRDQEKGKKILEQLKKIGLLQNE